MPRGTTLLGARGPHSGGAVCPSGGDLHGGQAPGLTPSPGRSWLRPPLLVPVAGARCQPNCRCPPTTGYDANQLLGRRADDLTHPAGRDPAGHAAGAEGGATRCVASSGRGDCRFVSANSGENAAWCAPHRLAGTYPRDAGSSVRRGGTDGHGARRDRRTASQRPQTRQRQRGSRRAGAGCGRAHAPARGDRPRRWASADGHRATGRQAGCRSGPTYGQSRRSGRAADDGSG